MIDHLTIILEDCNAQATGVSTLRAVGWTPACSTQKQGTTGTPSNGKRKQCALHAQSKPKCLQALGRYSGGIVGGQTTAERTRKHMITTNLHMRQLRDHIIATEPLEIAAYDLGITPDSLRRHIFRHPQEAT